METVKNRVFDLKYGSPLQPILGHCQMELLKSSVPDPNKGSLVTRLGP